MEEPRKLRTNMHSGTCYVSKAVSTQRCMHCRVHACTRGDQGKHWAGASASFFLSPPVASCDGVSQASSPRFGNARLEKGR